MRIPLPESLRPADGVDIENPAPTRDAATIVLLRDGANGLETYLLRRRSTLEFAPGVLVFPGGGVQESDRQPIEWIGPSAAEFAERFGCDEESARGLVVAAVRETFEESGVLFASTGPGETVVADTSEFEDERRALDKGDLDFAEFLAARGLTIRADLLGAWAHWVTPAFEPRRYDTRFFVARVPADQRVGELPGEADRAAWWAIKDLWPALESGSVIMLPPTAITCGELGDLSFADVPDAVANRTVIRIEPRLVDDGGNLFLEYAVDDPRSVVPEGGPQ
jgi:8-oxo-dGTP pyrophosphatase MutT (NUDIX family)